MKIKALVAVRSGSTRVLNKNMRPFAGKNLLQIKIEQLLRIPELDGVVINSNDDEMLKLAASFGCETVKRDQYYASNSVSMSEVYRNMAEEPSCRSPYHEEYIQTSVSGNSEGLCRSTYSFLSERR